MKEQAMKTTATLVATLMLAAAAAQADERLSLYGMPAPDAGAQTVVLKDGTRYVNVNDGETVRFVHGDKSFSWTFNTPERGAVVALDALAPREFDVHGVTVYVAPDPQYYNG
jgi:uncharacterized membrane protein